MKLPRGLPAGRLIRALESLGYVVIRQKGSHVRLRNVGPPPHVISVPLHSALRTSTLHGILSEGARMQSITIDSIVELL